MPQPKREQPIKPIIIELTHNLQNYMHSHNKMGFGWETPKLSIHDINDGIIDDMDNPHDD